MTFPFPHFIPASGSGAAWSGPSSGLTHRWPLTSDQVSGTTVNDVVGTLNGTMNASANFSSTTGPQGTDTALLFNGAAYVSLPSQPISGAPFSLFCWVKNNTHTQNTNPYIVSLCSNSSAAYFISGDGAKLLVCAGSPTTGAKCVASATMPFSVAAWHHVGFTYDGTTLTMYIDGAAVSTSADTGWSVASADYRFGNMRGNSDFLNGALKQVVVYNSALSAAQVSQLYAAY